MPKLLRLSGDDVVRILSSFGFEAVSQRGSHVKLRRMLSDGTRQTLIVPRDRELDSGTLRAIVRQASAHIPFEELKSHFFRN